MADAANITDVVQQYLSGNAPAATTSQSPVWDTSKLTYTETKLGDTGRTLSTPNVNEQRQAFDVLIQNILNQKPSGGTDYFNEMRNKLKGGLIATPETTPEPTTAPPMATVVQPAGMIADPGPSVAKYQEPDIQPGGASTDAQIQQYADEYVAGNYLIGDPQSDNYKKLMADPRFTSRVSALMEDPAKLAESQGIYDKMNASRVGSVYMDGGSFNPTAWKQQWMKGG